jgi:predicted translin family RNA/ssDNA-binding protein
MLAITQDDALKEFAEANIVNALIQNSDIPSPEKI